MPSKEFQVFVENFFGDPMPTARDGLNLQSLVRLAPQEKAQAETMLLQALEAGGHVDLRVIMGLSELRTQRASASLKKILHSLDAAGQPASPGSTRYLIEVALALWRIEQFPESLRHVIDALQKSPNEFARIDAAIALRQFRCQESLEALQSALRDEAYLVRSHVTKSILALCGQLPSETDTPPLAVQMMSDELNKRQAAIAELNVLTEQLSLPHCL